MALIVLHHGDEGAPDGQARSVQGMDKLWLTLSGLRNRAFMRRAWKDSQLLQDGDLTIAILTRQPHLDVVSLGGGGTHVAGAQRYHPIRYPKRCNTVSAWPISSSRAS